MAVWLSENLGLNFISTLFLFVAACGYHVGPNLALWTFGCWILEGRSTPHVTLQLMKFGEGWIDCQSHGAAGWGRHGQRRDERHSAALPISG